MTEGDPFPSARFGELIRRLPRYAKLAWALGRDERLSGSRRAALIAGAAYLVSPIDLVPDFLPVVGLLDDAILVALTLRWIVRAAGADLVHRHWRGTARGLQLLLRLTYRPGG